MNIGILGVGKLGLVYALSFERHGQRCPSVCRTNRVC